MATRKDDSLQAISVQLDGKNYSYWSYVMKNFLRGKSMWGYVSGGKTKPADSTAATYAAALELWESDNSKIITWINNSVTHSIGAQLAKYETAKQVWDHLSRLYTQSNFAKQYQLETDIRALQQNDTSIQEFYSAMTALWDQLALTEPAELSAFAPYITRRDSQRLVQFLMALRSDFEGLRGSILHRNPLPSVDDVVSELLAEEIRLKTQNDQKTGSSSTPSVFAASTRAPTGTQQKQHGKVAFDECSYCKQKNHWKAQCPLLLNRSKSQQQPSQQLRAPQQQSQHPQQQFRPPQQQFRPSQQQFRPPQPHDGIAAPSLDPSLIDQLQKFLAFQPQANVACQSQSTSAPSVNSFSSPGISSDKWIIDSGATNHMSHHLPSFVSLSPNSSMSIATASGNSVPLAGIGTIDTPSVSLSDVYYIPGLTMNLASVGKICDAGYNVFFSPSDCFV